MSALSLMYASTSDRRFKERLDCIVSEIAEAQQKHGDGYTGPFNRRVLLPEQLDHVEDVRHSLARDHSPKEAERGVTPFEARRALVPGSR